MRISYSATASASGAGPSAGELLDFISQVPPDAGTSVQTDRGDPREGSSWTISATWTQEDHQGWIESLKPKPKAPATRGGPGFGEQRDSAAGQGER